MSNRLLRNSPLAGTGFFRLWLGESASLAGSQVTAFALPVIAVLSLHASPWQMGILGAAASAANLVLGLPAGRLADTGDRLRIMHLANLCRALVLSVPPVLYATGHLTVAVLVVVTFLVGGLSLLFDSAMSAYLPRLVEARALTSANAWMQGSISVAEVAGPGLAGSLVQLLGAPVTLLADAASYLVSSLNLRAMPALPPDHEDAPEESLLRSFTAGATLLRRDGIQGPLAVAAAHFNFFTSMFFALYAIYVLRVLHFAPLLFGAVTMVGGAAGLGAAAVSNRLAARLGNGVLLLGAYGLPGVAGLLVPLAEGAARPVAVLLVALSAGMWAALVVLNLITSEAIKQAMVPNRLLGRVTAAVRFISWGVEPFGALAGGALGGSMLGLRGTMVLASVGVATSAVWPAAVGLRRLAAVSTAGGIDSTPEVGRVATGPGQPAP
jgi:MFS family permease